LVICPASLKLNWKKEISIYDDSDNVSIIQREWKPNKWTIINYDILDKFNTIEKPKKGKKPKFKFQEYDEVAVNNHILNEKFDLIICDEAHYLKSSSSNRTKHVKKIAKTIKKRWFLTGTPITNKPVDLFSLLSMVEHPLSTNYNSFLYSYCNAKTMMIKGRRIIKADGASNLEELNRRIKPVSIRRRKEDVLDLPDKIISPIYLQLDDDDKIDYDSSVERYIQMREEQGKNVSYAKKLVELSVLRRWVAENKLKHTKELINNSLESDKKVIVFTDYTSVVNTLREEYKDICVVINGETSQKDRQKAVEDFQNNPNVRLFIGNTVAAGVGLTLTAAEVVIVNDLNWTPANVDQSLDRAFRIGQTKDVICYFPLFDDTIDTIVYEVLDKKRDIINMAIDGVIDNKGVIEEVIDRLDNKYKK
jgi:SWI/SNF-related matrix-associated actin-dependent regulator 1 of chromatin subfamily A